MVIDNFYLISIAALPLKAHAPLVVDANTLLTFSISAQFFQPICGRHAQIMGVDGVVYHTQLAQSDLLNIGWQFTRTLSLINLSSLFIFEGSYHSLII